MTISTTPDIASERHPTSKQVRANFGGMSDLSLWRWLNNPTMGFPLPIYITGRRYWRDAVLSTWLSAQQSAAPFKKSA